MSGGLPPEVVRRNRELLAERDDWPADALAECLKIEDECPGFHASWFPEWKPANPDFQCEAGFYAWITGNQPGQMWSDGWHGRQEWYGATAAELRAKLGG
jgi:hypothetical protein